MPASTPTTPTRNRVHSGNVEEGRAASDFNEPPSPPPPPSSEKIAGGLSWALFMNSSFKNNLVAAIGEIVGTTMFLFFAFAGTQVANVNSVVLETTTTNATTGFNPQKLLYISLSFGFSLMVNVWIFFRISGGLFNPAVCASIQSLCFS
jgi:glycerol uptake facilitator-like aquaporin